MRNEWLQGSFSLKITRSQVGEGARPPVARAPDHRSAGAVSRPVTAVAAATCGETRWVREPLPWRPSKLRLEVDALRWPGASLSGFMPRHMEHPADRHSATSRAAR